MNTVGLILAVAGQLLARSTTQTFRSGRNILFGLTLDLLGSTFVLYGRLSRSSGGETEERAQMSPVG